MTTALIARQRARQSRIRAFVRVAGRHYDVYSHGTRYQVWYNCHAERWECLCPTRGGKLCKHIQRVLDREEKRIKQISLAHERLQYV